ncbi:hypothetical protein HGH92_00490 [Chitinophaga varians]|uniref:Uncharacterized protein n=1 Tax=Chitinophaga varians TaxID=2202339 RepID=A0A847RPJ9_9BACT|nr:hypothetical protein [Chitinophaga varians]NLR62767.1 hypothetical protein [Chitinophaga varians]
MLHSLFPLKVSGHSGFRPATGFHYIISVSVQWGIAWLQALSPFSLLYIFQVITGDISVLCFRLVIVSALVQCFISL